MAETEINHNWSLRRQSSVQSTLESRDIVKIKLAQDLVVAISSGLDELSRQMATSLAEGMTYGR